MINKNEIKICVIGLGYVGLPIALEFNKKYPVVGFDIDEKRVVELKKGIDRTHEVSSSEFENAQGILFTSNSDNISFSFWKFLINSIKDFLSTIKKYNEKATIIETNIEINLI